MKKIGLLIALSTLIITGCAANARGSKTNIMDSLFNNSSSVNSMSVSQSQDSLSINSEGKPVYQKVDIDLTTLNSTLVYSQVLNFFDNPSKYVGKIVKMAGPCSIYYEDDRVYPSIIIPDATACCASGLEFVLYGLPMCPRQGGNGYPLDNEEATIIGRFEKYLEMGSLYIHLVDAIWVK